MLPTEYEVREGLVRTPFFVLSCGIRRNDQRPVLLKCPGATTMGAYDQLRLEHEYRILDSLICPGIPKPTEFVRRKGQCCIVFEDRGERPLNDQTPNAPALSL